MGILWREALPELVSGDNRGRCAREAMVAKDAPAGLRAFLRLRLLGLKKAPRRHVGTQNDGRPRQNFARDLLDCQKLDENI